MPDCSENMLEKYPDLEARVPSLLAENVKTVVVDCEAVAWDMQQHKILPFQVMISVSADESGLQPSRDCYCWCLGTDSCPVRYHGPGAPVHQPAALKLAKEQTPS